MREFIKQHRYQILCVMFFVVILILVGILLYPHFLEPDKPVWKSSILVDTSKADTIIVYKK